MKLRLPSKLVAAILAAASPVLLQTLSSATLGVAAVAAVAGHQAVGDVSITTNTTWNGESTDIPDSGNVSVDGNSAFLTITTNVGNAQQALNEFELKNGGDVTVSGEGTNVYITRLLLHNAKSSNGEIFTIEDGATVNVTKATDSPGYTNAAILIGHWPNGNATNTQLLVNEGGTLNALSGWTHISRDSGASLIIGGGTANLKGIEYDDDRNHASAVTLSSGTLNIGSLGIIDNHNTMVTNHQLNLSGGTLGTLDSDWAIKNITMTLSNTATIDTTKTTGDAEGQGATVSLHTRTTTTGSGKLAVTGVGTLSVADGTVLGHTGGTEVANGATLSLGTGVTLGGGIANADGGVVNVAGTLTNTGADSNFTQAKLTLTQAVDGGNYTYGGVLTTEVSGNGIAESATLRRVITGVTESAVDGAVVYVGGEAAATAWTDNALNVKTNIGNYYVVNDTASFTDASVFNGTKGLVVQNNATMTLGVGSGADGAIHGTVEVKSGSTLKTTVGDTMGWGETAVTSLLVENGATVELAHGGNETFVGALMLNGTITGNSGSTWDMYSSGARVSSLSVDDGQTATISTTNLRLRHDNVDFNVGTGATLNVSANITKNEGNGTLVKSGAGVMNLTGTLGGISALSLQGGTLKLNHDISLNGANKITGSGDLQILGGTTQLGGGDNGSFTGNILVSGEGAELKLLGNNTGLGAANRDNTARVIKAENGGVINFNGQYDGATYNYAITLGNNGSLVNKGGNMPDGKMQLAKLYVTGSNATAYVGGTAIFGLLAQGHNGTTLQLNGNTLEKIGTNDFMLINTTVSNGGTIRLTGGRILIGTSNANRATTAQNVNFEFNGGTLNIGTTENPGLTAGGLTMKSGYEGNGSITGGGHLTLTLGNNANNTYRGTMAIGNLTVNGGTNRTQTLNLTEPSTASAISVSNGATLALGSESGTTLTATSAKVTNADSLLRVEGAQLNLTNDLQVSESGGAGAFTMTSGGVKGTTTNLWKAANINILGGSLEFTTAQGFTFNHGSTNDAKSTTNMGVASDGALSADGAVVLKATNNDWAIKLKNNAIFNLGNVTIDAANGIHNITLQSADGSSSGTLNLYGTVTNNAQFTLGGTLNVMGDGVLTHYAANPDENGFTTSNYIWTLVKGGEGATTTLLENSTATHATRGTLTLDNTDNTLTASTAKTGSTIYYIGVNDTAYSDLSSEVTSAATGYYIGADKTFNVTGDNLDARSIILGKGATLKATTGSDFGHRQISGMTLEGDATVDAQANIGIIAASYGAAKLNLNGHTLTVTGSGTFAVINTTADEGTIYLNGGTLQAGHGSQQTTINATETLLKFNQGNVRLSNGSTLKAEGLTGTGSILREGNTTPNLELEPTLSDSPYTFTGNLGTFGMNVTMLATSTGEQQFNLTQNATLGSITVNGGKLTFGGSSTLTAGAATLGNGTLALNTTANLTEITATSGTTSTLTGTGNINLTTTAHAHDNPHGLVVNGGATVNVTASSVTLASGALYNNGTLNIGDGTHETVVKAKYLINGNINNASYRTSTLNIANNATVAITGADNNDTHITGVVFSEWNNNTTVTVSGNLLAQNATVKGGNWGSFLNIENGGVLATLGISGNVNVTDSTVNLKDGGSLILGGNTSTNNGTTTAQAGSTIGIYADSVTFARNMTLSAAAGKAVTIDTKKYAFNADGTAIAQADDATGGTLTISGNLSGDGALTVIGNGALVLSGTNTYSGATTVTGGSVTYSNTYNGSVLNLSGDGTTVTFNGAGSGFSGNINADAAGGTLTVNGTSELSANTITITKGTKLNFEQKVTLTSNSRPSFLYGESGTSEGTELNFNGGYAYTGAGNTGGYAMTVGKQVTVSLGGTSDLTGKSIGMETGATLKLQNNATLTVGRIYNASSFDNNANVSMGAGSTLNVTGSGSNSIVSLDLGSDSTANFSNAATTIGTLSIDSGTATLKHGTNAVTANTTNLQDGEQLNVFYSNDRGAVSLGTVALESGAATIKTTNHGGELNISTLSGTGTLTLRAQSDSAVTSTFNIGSADNTKTLFNGTLVLDQANSTGGTRTITWLLKDDKTATNADVVLKRSTSGTNTVNAKLALDTAHVALKSLSDATGTGTYSTSVFHIAKGSSVTADSATLELTGAGDHTTAATVDAGVSLTMSGSDTQTFSGDMSAFNKTLTVNSGTMALTGTLGFTAASVNIAEGAHLKLTGSGDTTISRLTMKYADSTSARVGGTLTYAGGNALTLNSINEPHNQGTLVIENGAVLAKKTAIAEQSNESKVLDEVVVSFADKTADEAPNRVLAFNQGGTYNSETGELTGGTMLDGFVAGLSGHRGTVIAGTLTINVAEGKSYEFLHRYDESGHTDDNAVLQVNKLYKNGEGTQVIGGEYTTERGFTEKGLYIEGGVYVTGGTLHMKTRGTVTADFSVAGSGTLLTTDNSTNCTSTVGAVKYDGTVTLFGGGTLNYADGSTYITDGLYVDHMGQVINSQDKNQFIAGIYNGKEYPGVLLNFTRAESESNGVAINVLTAAADYEHAYAGTVCLKNENDRNEVYGLQVLGESAKNALARAVVDFSDEGGRTVLSFRNNTEASSDWSNSKMDGSVAGLTGTNGAVYANTLTINTANGADYTYGGALNVSGVIQTGAGTQTLSGDMSNFNGALTATDGTLAISGEKKVNTSGIHANGGTIASVGGATISIDRMTANNQFTIGSSGSISVEQGGKFELANWWSFTMEALGTSPATMTAGATSAADANFAFNRTDITISNAKVSYTANASATVDNKFEGSTIVKTGTGTLTVTNAENTLVGVYAEGGNITVQNAASSAATAEREGSLKRIKATGGNVSLQGLTAATHLSLSELVIGDSKTVAALVKDSHTADNNEDVATIEVTGTLTVGQNANLNANLVMKAGSTYDMSNGNALNLGCALTLEQGETLTLSDTQAEFLKANNYLVLYEGVDSLTLKGTDYVDYKGAIKKGLGDVGVDATAYFTNLVTAINAAEGSHFYVTYSGADNGGIVAIVPEPATSVLSLLALAGMAARRRRK